MEKNETIQRVRRKKITMRALLAIFLLTATSAGWLAPQNVFASEWKRNLPWSGTKYDKDANITATYSEGIRKNK